MEHVSQSGPPPPGSSDDQPRVPPSSVPPAVPPGQAPGWGPSRQWGAGQPEWGAGQPQGQGWGAGQPQGQGWGTGQPPAPTDPAAAWGTPPPYSAYGWGGPPPAPKPGTIPLRPLGVGDILEGTFSVIRRYPGATLGSAALVVGIVSVLQVLLLLPVLGSVESLLDTATSTPDEVVAVAESLPWLLLAAGSIVVALLSFALFVLLAGVLSVVVGRSAIGEPLSFSQAWRRTLPRFGRLVGASVLVVLLIASIWVAVTIVWVVAALLDAGAAYVVATLLTLAAIPVTIYLGVSVALTTPAVALESTAAGPIGPVTGLRRSRTLTRRAWWRTFGILLLGAVIAGALSQVIAVPVGIILSVAPLGSTLSIVASTFAAGLGQAVAAPISGLILALVYVDRRIRTEQLDVALARAAGVDLPPQPGSAP
jgi:hypothetical protein